MILETLIAILILLAVERVWFWLRSIERLIPARPVKLTIPRARVVRAPVSYDYVDLMCALALGCALAPLVAVGLLLWLGN